MPSRAPPRKTPRTKAKPRRSLFKQIFWFSLAALFLIGLGFAIPAFWHAQVWWEEAIVLTDQHAGYQVSHPGWSFPARLQTAEVEIENTPVSRLYYEARARGYVEDCKETGPGEFCEKTKKVIPRQGNKLEPIELGWIIGPDAEVREHLPVKEAPKILLDAILAAEDREFYQHNGVNFSAMMRAVLANAQEGSYAQGASTLSMQVVRNLGQRKEKTAARKMREMVQAMALDSHLGKEGVLQMYLDAPYLGQDDSLSICGFRAASKYYFGHDVGELTLAEAATLAAILPAPGKFSPDRHPDRAKEKRDRVLDTLQAFMAYSADEIADAKATPVQVSPEVERTVRYPAYYTAARAYLEQTLDPAILYGAGLTITVGMNVGMQEQTNELFEKKVPWLEGIIGRRKEPLQAAGLFLDHQTGLILSIWGGNDVTEISFNRATQARRQPGSSFKPMVYALAFSQPPVDGKPAYTAASAVPNQIHTFKTPQGPWSPRNNGGEYSTKACLAYGLAWSQNIATASLMEELGGPKPLIDFAKKMGFDTSKFPEEYGIALGQAEVTVQEMAQYAGIIANGGRQITATPILRAIDAAGVERIAPPSMKDAIISPEAAALTRELMELVITTGTGGAARGAGGEAGYNGPAMGKTGTTDRERDLWFVGATPRYAAAIWMGYDQPNSLGWAASDLAAPLWGWWVGRLTKAEGPPPDFPTDPKIEHRGICRVTGRASNGSCPLISAPFLPGTAPKGACTISHPPPEPEIEGEFVEGELGPDGKPKKRKHESLWKKRARIAEEKAAAEVSAPADGASAPPLQSPQPPPAPTTP